MEKEKEAVGKKEEGRGGEEGGGPREGERGGVGYQLARLELTWRGTPS